MTAELIKTARRITGAARHKPSQADLRRAVSTAYYAVFDALARTCAEEIVGSSAPKRASLEWTRVYRALNHGRSEGALDELDPHRKGKAKRGLEIAIHPDIATLCETLEILRQRRIEADYDPKALRLKRQQVVELIDDAEAAIERLAAAPTDQRQAFCFICILPFRRV